VIAKNTPFLDFIGIKAQFFVPIYQRKYSWELIHCKKLFDDIVKVAEDKHRPCHFIGSVIYLAKEEIQHASAIKEYLVIDGQQRMTTLSLLLLALGEYSDKVYAEAPERATHAHTTSEAIADDYLTNKRECGDLFFKVKLNAEDFSIYKDLIQKRPISNRQTAPGLCDNYEYFLQRMQEERIDPQLIFDGLKKLVIIDTCLAPEDNPQLVFETVNSTGMPLSISDKIRNFLLMTVAPAEQERLYDEYWHPMELDLGLNERDVAHFNQFFRYYLTAVTDKRVGNEYYEEFKDHYHTHHENSTEQLVAHIRKFSKHFLRCERAASDTFGIDYALYRIRILGQNNITPALMRVLDDVSTGIVSESDAVKVFSIIESYWVRRSLCDLPTNTAGPVCISILKSLGAAEYVDSVITTIVSGLTWAQRMPTDAEMMQTMQTMPIYGRSFWERKLLDLLEQHECREYILNDKNFSIEHIMPQTVGETDDPEKDWVADLGEDWKRIHDTYLNTIGNLTLTGFNSQYSNYRFLHKRDMEDGYAHTPIRISASLAKREKWGEAEILERAHELTNIILDIWKYPSK